MVIFGQLLVEIGLLFNLTSGHTAKDRQTLELVNCLGRPHAGVSLIQLINLIQLVILIQLIRPLPKAKSTLAGCVSKCQLL